VAYPVPPDARAVGDFEIVRGIDSMIRQTVPIADTTEDFDLGEWVKLVTSGGFTKAQKLEAAQDITTPALGARCCWTLYRDGDSDSGQSDAMATKTLDLLSGTYQAKTKFYNTSGTFGPGYPLCAVYHATLGGVLDAPDPATPLSNTQLQSVVARCIEVVDGVLHYEAPCM
jgi:hypothetical protein